MSRAPCCRGRRGRRFRGRRPDLPNFRCLGLIVPEGYAQLDLARGGWKVASRLRLFGGSGYEQAKAKLRCIESDEVAFAFGPPS